jgi:segregation and condensation protein B
MSLKAKLEAVIYAAEEPITLAQMAALFAGEALIWKTAGTNGGSPASSEDSAEVYQEGLDLPVEAVTEPAQEGESAVAGSLPDADAEAKRISRQRDREVRETLREVLDELVADYAAGERGIEIREIAGGYRMATKPEYHDAVRQFVRSLKPPMKLSMPALETLAVIAYKQPVTAPEVGEIRGVDSAGVLGSLISRKLITTAGRKPVVGRPILYKTTKEFLLRFGLKDVSELPSMEEFEKMAAIELSDAEEAADESAGAENGDLFAETAQDGREREMPNAEIASFESAS